MVPVRSARADWRAEANTAALHHWARALTRFTFQLWRCTAEALIESTILSAMRCRQSRAIRSWNERCHESSGKWRRKRMAGLCSSRARRRRLRTAVGCWSQVASRAAARTTLPIRAESFDFCRLGGRAMRAWLQWLIQCEASRALLRKLRQNLRPVFLPSALHIWQQRVSLAREKKRHCVLARMHRARFLLQLCISGLTRYADQRCKKAARQGLALEMFRTAAQKEALRRLSSVHSRVLAEKDVRATQAWPAGSVELLPLLRRWRSLVHASKLEVISTMPNYTGSSLSLKSWHDTELAKSRSQDVECFFHRLHHELKGKSDVTSGSLGPVV